MQAKFSVQPAVRFTQKHSFRTGWRWGRDVERFMELEVSRLDIERPVLHLCSGSSRLGDVTVDAVHENASLRADAFHLPFRDAAFPTILADPPYELNIRERVRLGMEMARVHRGGGSVDLEGAVVALGRSVSDSRCGCAEHSCGLAAQRPLADSGDQARAEAAQQGGW